MHTMNEAFYKEMRKCAVQLREELTDDESVEKAFLDPIRELTRLLVVGRREGLLQLEEEIETKSFCALPLSDDLAWLVKMVTNAVDEDLIESLSLIRFYSRAYCGWKGVLYLMYVYAAHLIQYAEIPYILQLMVEAVFPDTIGKSIGPIIEGWIPVHRSSR